MCVVEFTKCLENGDVQTCAWYLDQLKAVSALFASSVDDPLITSSFYPYAVPGRCLPILKPVYVFMGCVDTLAVVYGYFDMD